LIFFSKNDLVGCHGNLANGLATDQPVLDGRAFEGFVMALVFPDFGVHVCSP
jgi:hypothetical protein